MDRSEIDPENNSNALTQKQQKKTTLTNAVDREMNAKHAGSLGGPASGTINASHFCLVFFCFFSAIVRQNEAAGVKINSVGISSIISFLCTAPCCLHAYIHMSTPCRYSLQTKQGFRGVNEARTAFVVLHVVRLHLTLKTPARSLEVYLFRLCV